MSLLSEHIALLRGFLRKSHFSQNGAIILDLDGTALHEHQGKVFISGSVEKGVREVTALRRPVIINTLRFPLSVIRKVAPEWLGYVPEIPSILLNGSLCGTIKHSDSGEICFYEEQAHVLHSDEIHKFIAGIRELLENNVRSLDVFYYPRNWRKGEIIWVPDATRVPLVQERYKSASLVHDGPVESLSESLLKEDICMIMLLIDSPKDRLMAYQHQEPSDFFTHLGVNKSYGLHEYARKKDISLLDSIGGGDTPMDTFLSEVGFSVIVGDPKYCPYRGRVETISLKDPADLGDLLVTLARTIRGADL